MDLENGAPQEEAPRKEGDLYRIVTAFGRSFELRFGFYDERDRQSPLCEPAVLYPDFLKAPVFTRRGEPFATVMQDACDFYKGAPPKTPDTTCAECRYFKEGEEWFGICTCPKNRKRE